MKQSRAGSGQNEDRARTVPGKGKGQDKIEAWPMHGLCKGNDRNSVKAGHRQSQDRARHVSRSQKYPGSWTRRKDPKLR